MLADGGEHFNTNVQFLQVCAAAAICAPAAERQD
jgi:hypothetical protein